MNNIFCQYCLPSQRRIVLKPEEKAASHSHLNHGNINVEINPLTVREPVQCWQPATQAGAELEIRFPVSGIRYRGNDKYLVFAAECTARKRRQCSELIVKCFGSISLQFIIRPPGAAAAPFLGSNRGRHRNFTGNRENKWQGGEDATKRFIMTEIIPVPFFLCFWPRLLSIAVSCLPFSLFMNMSNDLRKNIITV